MLLSKGKEGDDVRQRPEASAALHLKKGALFGAKKRVLADAMPPVPGDFAAGSATFGWIEGGIETPATGGAYVVEFLGENDVVVLAYFDPYGRAFSTDVPLSVPPAREPDMAFARWRDQPTPNEERGCVEVRSEGGAREVAQYGCARSRYRLFDAWIDFGPHAARLSYADAMARAYLAFVHRPKLGARDVPERGLASVFSWLRAEKPLAALRRIAAEVREAGEDPAFRPPALVRCLALWLAEAGLGEINAREAGDGALRLVRTARYANTYYLAVEDEDAGIEPRTVWALEAALNRFLLVAEAFGDAAATATDVDCARWDAYLVETAAVQRPPFGQVADAPSAPCDGEWEFRCAVGRAVERLRLPVRIEAVAGADLSAGLAAFDVVVPDASLMPEWTWAEASQPGMAGSWELSDAEEREAQALRYAEHLGIALAGIAFEASSAVRRVEVVARPLAGAGEGRGADGSARAGEFPRGAHGPALYRVAFDRSTYEATAGFESARAGDPRLLFCEVGAQLNLSEADAFGTLRALPSARLRRDLPEAEDALLPPSAREALGADRCADLRISHDAVLRRMGEGLADRIVRASSATEAIRIVRAAQERAIAEADTRAVAACTRLMAALAGGEVEVDDQNAVVGKFLGEDRCLAALARARTLASRDPEAAADVLIDAVAEAVALDGYADGSSEVYRSFDLYASRVLYNRALRAHCDGCAPCDGARMPALARVTRDAGRRIALVPDSFYLCHLEIVRLLERSFERADEALRFGQRAVEMAPTVAAGFCRLGRAYMLVGDMENAAEVLMEGLRVAVQPNDIALLYYQLAYVLWKAGKSSAGAACYVKSLSASSAFVLQASAELQELVEETGEELPGHGEVDVALARAAIPVAPTEEVLEVLAAGAVAATDAGVFAVARSLLSLRLRYRPDDALVNVLRSLEVGSA
ncbi:hypothetical protein [Rubneribacter badeniensis]|uniref:hypothetical protein n=1 Tax=Rubneribacter badeniensis TaxID=2070688 RepID=UPI003A8FEBD2